MFGARKRLLELLLGMRKYKYYMTGYWLLVQNQGRVWLRWVSLFTYKSFMITCWTRDRQLVPRL